MTTICSRYLLRQWHDTAHDKELRKEGVKGNSALARRVQQKLDELGCDVGSATGGAGFTWSGELRKQYIQEQHGKSKRHDCFSDKKTAMRKCEQTPDCGAITYQTEWTGECNYKYRVVHSGPTLKFWNDNRIVSYTLTRKLILPGLEVCLQYLAQLVWSSSAWKHESKSWPDL